MTYELHTESHGNVESGFYATFTQFARLGEYTFATRTLCELVRNLAEHPEVKTTAIFGYDVDKFWQRAEDYDHEVIQMLMEGGSPNNIQSQLKERDVEVSLDDVFDLNNEGMHVPITVSKDSRSINIGEYKISSFYFGRFASYLARGGIMGWEEDNVPDFSERTSKAIKESKNPLYQEIQKRL